MKTERWRGRRVVDRRAALLSITNIWIKTCSLIYQISYTWYNNKDTVIILHINRWTKRVNLWSSPALPRGRRADGGGPQGWPFVPLLNITSCSHLIVSTHTLCTTINTKYNFIAKLYNVLVSAATDEHRRPRMHCSNGDILKWKMQLTHTILYVIRSSQVSQPTAFSRIEKKKKTYLGQETDILKQTSSWDSKRNRPTTSMLELAREAELFTVLPDKHNNSTNTRALKKIRWKVIKKHER